MERERAKLCSEKEELQKLLAEKDAEALELRGQNRAFEESRAEEVALRPSGIDQSWRAAAALGQKSYAPCRFLARGGSLGFLGSSRY